MGLQKMTKDDVEKAMRAIANYYRDADLFLYASNTTDAYDYYVNEFTKDTEIIVEQGYSYKFKNNYVIAMDMKKLFEEYPEVCEHYFRCGTGIYETVKRERDDCLFICALGPDGGSMTRNSIKAIKMFLKLYEDDYAILTDCPTGYDSKMFEKWTGMSRRLNSYGSEECWRYDKVK